MKARTVSLLAFALAAVIALGMPVSAEFDDPNPPEGEVEMIEANQTLFVNEGTVRYNRGTVSSNKGDVEINEGRVEINNGTVGINSNIGGIVLCNAPEGKVESNSGIVNANNGRVGKNYTTVETNTGTVETNTGTVETNIGTVETNTGTVETNTGTVTNNYGTVSNNSGTVTNNYGTVTNVGGGRVLNNFGGHVEGGSIRQYYELPVPQNFSYEGATEGNSKWWIGNDDLITVRAAEGKHFGDVTIQEGKGKITMSEDHKSFTLTNVTGNLTNGVLKLDVQEGDYTPEQSTPTPDPTPEQPTTPAAPNNTATETVSAPAVQQMESAERPDPQDVEANERYNFWMGVKADLRAAADGETLRIHVPVAYANMPASVMEQIRLLDKEVVVDLRWNGERFTITPATAQRKTALKAFWTFAQLCELYEQ